MSVTPTLTPATAVAAKYGLTAMTVEKVRSLLRPNLAAAEFARLPLPLAIGNMAALADPDKRGDAAHYASAAYEARFKTFAEGFMRDMFGDNWRQIALRLQQGIVEKNEALAPEALGLHKDKMGGYRFEELAAYAPVENMLIFAANTNMPVYVRNGGALPDYVFTAAMKEICGEKPPTPAILLQKNTPEALAQRKEMSRRRLTANLLNQGDSFVPASGQILFYVDQTIHAARPTPAQDAGPRVTYLHVAKLRSPQ